jgi:hypothetical protein
MSKLDYRAIRSRVEAYRSSVWKRAQATCVAAGLDAYGTLHNAMVSYDQGKPWREVDYSKARLARRLFEQQFAAHRVLDRLYSKHGPNGFTF